MVKEEDPYRAIMFTHKPKDKYKRSVDIEDSDYYDHAERPETYIKDGETYYDIETETPLHVFIHCDLEGKKDNVFTPKCSIHYNYTIRDVIHAWGDKWYYYRDHMKQDLDKELPLSTYHGRIREDIDIITMEQIDEDNTIEFIPDYGLSIKPPTFDTREEAVDYAHGFAELAGKHGVAAIEKAFDRLPNMLLKKMRDYEFEDKKLELSNKKLKKLKNALAFRDIDIIPENLGVIWKAKQQIIKKREEL